MDRRRKARCTPASSSFHRPPSSGPRRTMCEAAHADQPRPTSGEGGATTPANLHIRDPSQSRGPACRRCSPGRPGRRRRTAPTRSSWRSRRNRRSTRARPAAPIVAPAAVAGQAIHRFGQCRRIAVRAPPGRSPRARRSRAARRRHCTPPGHHGPALRPLRCRIPPTWPCGPARWPTPTDGLTSAGGTARSRWTTSSSPSWAGARTPPPPGGRRRPRSGAPRGPPGPGGEPRPPACGRSPSSSGDGRWTAPAEGGGRADRYRAGGSRVDLVDVDGRRDDGVGQTGGAPRCTARRHRSVPSTWTAAARSHTSR